MFMALLMATFSLSSTSSVQAVVDNTAPSAPSNLAATVISSAQINLSWSASTDNVGVTGYAIFRNGLQIASTTSTAFSNNSLSASTTYAYTVKAYDAAGNKSNFSNSVSASTLAVATDNVAPSIPSNLSATAISSAQINLSWNTSTDNIAVTGYAIFRDGLEIANISATNFSDLGLSASTSYAYTVKAYDAAGNRSGFSNTSTATTLATSTDTTAPSAPTNLIASAVSTSQINLTWNTSTDNVGVSGYSIYRDGTKIAFVTSNTYSNMGLSASTTYSYIVRASDVAGNMSANSNTATATTLATSTDTTAPSTPSNLVATAASSARINLNWSASTDNVGVTGYAIYRDSSKIADTSATSFSDLGLSASTTYAYTVKAYDAAGNTSANSNIASATTLKGSNDNSAPNAPRKLKAHVVSYTHVNLKWKAPENKKGVKGYVIFRNGFKIATVKRNHYNDIRLNPSTSYSYTVKAYDKAGNLSADSNKISVTTLTRVSTRNHDNDDDNDDDHDKLNKEKDDYSSKIEKVKNIISEKLEKVKSKDQNKKKYKFYLYIYT